MFPILEFSLKIDELLEPSVQVVVEGVRNIVRPNKFAPKLQTPPGNYPPAMQDTAALMTENRRVFRNGRCEE